MIKKHITLIILITCSYYISAFTRNIEFGTLKISDRAKQYVNEVLNSNRLSYGPFLKKFEQTFAQMHNAKFAATSNSGTSSLQIALQALKELLNWHDGDEVIVPAITFVASSNIVLHNKMVPVFVDVDKDYYEIDPSLIEAKITPRTRAIIAVHLFGQPCDMDPIIALAQKYNLKIIEDSCETMFAKYKGNYVGTLGDIGCFSTYVSHLLTTGVGGLSTTNNPEYAVKMRSLLNHGRDSIYLSMDDDDNKNETEMKEIIAKRFSFISIGHSFRITELEGALGLAQLEDGLDFITKRQENARYLINGLQHLTDYLQLPKVRPGSDHVFMMFPLVLKSESKVNLVNYLEKQGIETRDMLPLICQPIYQKMFDIKKGDYPIADWINENGFYIGCHQNLTHEDLDYIIKTLSDYFSSQKTITCESSATSDPNNRQSSFPYISGDTFRAACNFIVDSAAQKFDPKDIQRGSIVFVESGFLEHFFYHIHPYIEHAYVLVTHNSDMAIPGKFEKYLENPKIYHWFGQNIDRTHPKLTGIPIGLANRYWPHGNIAAVNTHLTAQAHQHTGLLYMNFLTGTNTGVRLAVANYFSNKPFCTKASQKPFHNYLDDLQSFKFIISPRGNGLDCHRHWEALLMGCIPIMQHSTLDPLFEGLPVLLIDNWNEVTEEFLLKKYEEIQNKTYFKERLLINYWLNLIKQKQNEARNAI